MGCRLYPMTKNVANLETLAGVPEGTHARLDAVKAKYNTNDPALTFFARQDLYEKQWHEVNACPHMGQLDHFLTFGWGKFGDMHNITGGKYGGSETDLVRCTLLARSNGIEYDPAVCEGLCWG